MALTYTAIATVTVGSGGAANMEFTSIPGTYTDLVILSSFRSSQSGAALVNISLNGSTANFTSRYLYGDGSSTASGTDAPRLINYATGTSITANAFSNGFLYIPNYTSSNNKSLSADMVVEQNSATNIMVLNAILWSNTAAITSITLTPAAGTLAQYSTATLYGIKNTV